MLVCVLAVVAMRVGTAAAQTAPSTTMQQAQGTMQSAQVNTQARAAGFWKVFDCVLAAAAFATGNAYLALKIKKAGGVIKFAKRVWKAKGADGKFQVVINPIGYVTGAGTLVRACTP